MKKTTLLLITFLIVTGVSQEIVWVKTLPLTQAYDNMDVAVDSRSCVIVSVNPWIVKFSPEGESLWAREIHLPQNPIESFTQSVATDPEDNIIVGRSTSETSWAVVKLTSTGESLWTWDTVISPRTNTYWLADLGTNSSGYIVATGCDHGTYYGKWVTFQITPDGHTHWSRTFSSNWGPDFAWSVCTDPENNVIVGGARGICLRPRQWYPQLIKYSKNGETLAQIVYDTHPFPANLQGTGVATDFNGNMYLSGYGGIYETHGRYRWYGAFLFKYDPQGNLLWQWFSDTASEGYDYCTDCATDTSGNIYTARTTSWNGRATMILRRFQPSGETVWTFYYPLRHNTLEPCWVSIAIDREGNIIAVVACEYYGERKGYVLKIANIPGIAEGSERCEPSNFLPPTVINSAQTKRLSFPPDVRVEMFDKTGRLLQKFTGEKKASLLHPGVYFLRFSSSVYQGNIKLVVVK
jgi:hypothetical protein